MLQKKHGWWAMQMSRQRRFETLIDFTTVQQDAFVTLVDEFPEIDRVINQRRIEQRDLT